MSAGTAVQKRRHLDVIKYLDNLGTVECHARRQTSNAKQLHILRPYMYFYYQIPSTLATSPEVIFVLNKAVSADAFLAISK